MKCVLLFIALVSIIFAPIQAHADWTALYTGVTHSLYSSYFLTNQNGFAAGFENNDDPIVISTTNAGMAWNQVIPYSQTSIYSIFFVNEFNGCTVGRHSDNGCGIIIQTADGGNNWNDITWQMGCNILYDIDFPSDTLGYVSGDNGKVYRSVNNGTWISTANIDDIIVRYIDFIDNDTGYAVAGESLDATDTIYRTENAGGSWDIVHTFSDFSTTGLYFFDYNHAILIGRNTLSDAEQIMRTTNACSTWSIVYTGLSNNVLHDVHFYAMRGWAVGNDGRILRSDNAGSNWYLDGTVSPAVDLFSVFDSGESIYTAGENGKVFKKTEIYAAEEIPLPEIICTSFPNPFSTTTTISFKAKNILNEPSQIRIYTIKGQRVRSLPLTSSPLHIVEATWDGRDENGIEAGSGVYFYKINDANEHVGKVVKLR